MSDLDDTWTDAGASRRVVLTPADADALYGLFKDAFPDAFVMPSHPWWRDPAREPALPFADKPSDTPGCDAVLHFPEAHWRPALKWIPHATSTVLVPPQGRWWFDRYPGPALFLGGARPTVAREARQWAPTEEPYASTLYIPSTELMFSYRADSVRDKAIKAKLWRIHAKFSVPGFAKIDWKDRKRSPVLIKHWIGPDAARWCREEDNRALGLEIMKYASVGWIPEERVVEG